MPLDADWVVDRRRLKRHLTLWRLAALAAVVVAVVLVLAGRTSGGYIGGDYVARIDVAGLIVYDRAIEEKLEQIANEPRARALLVTINSGGGTVVGGERLYHAFRRIAAKKPVVAVMDELATSAAYMTALGADRIFANPGTVTGSIGVIMQTADVTGLLEKLGISPINIKSSPLKAQPNPLEPMSEEARAVMQSVIRDFYDFFVGLVAERRGLALDVAQGLADGRVFSGRQALQAGLIDAIGGEREARVWLAETHGVAADLPVLDVEADEEERFLRQIVGESIGKALFPERLSLDGLISVWHPSLQ